MKEIEREKWERGREREREIEIMRERGREREREIEIMRERGREREREIEIMREGERERESCSLAHLYVFFQPLFSLQQCSGVQISTGERKF